MEFGLALQVVTADVIHLMIFPPLIYYRTAGPDTLESLGCSVLGFVGTLCFSVRYNAMLVLSLDRFNAVFFPFWYTLNGNKFIFSFCAATWVVAVFLALVPVSFDCFGYDSTGLCSLSVTLACGSFCSGYRYMINLILFLTGGILPTILYALMFWKAIQGNWRQESLLPNRNQQIQQPLPMNRRRGQGLLSCCYF